MSAKIMINKYERFIIISFFFFYSWFSKLSKLYIYQWEISVSYVS